MQAASGSVRIFCDYELSRLDLGSRGFLSFLETSGVLDERRRELVIERALAMPDAEVTVSQFKVIVLMVLWQERAAVDPLILDELLTDESDEPASLWQEAVIIH